MDECGLSERILRVKLMSGEKKTVFKTKYPIMDAEEVADFGFSYFQLETLK